MKEGLYCPYFTIKGAEGAQGNAYFSNHIVWNLASGGKGISLWMWIIINGKLLIHMQKLLIVL